MESIRGNLDTRLRKLDEGQYEAIVLAAAGLRRMGWQERIAELLPEEVMCPAVGQGALAVEISGANETARQVCAGLDHQSTRQAVTAERAVLAGLGGGCQVPIGAYAKVEDGRLRMRAVVIAPDGASLVARTIEGAAAEAAALGAALARELLSAGARRILESVYGTA